jgi:hypothetical protein
MMEKLIGRGEELARGAQQARLSGIAGKLKAMLGEASVEIEESQLVITGRGIIKRWLIDPSLRFLAALK